MRRDGSRDTDTSDPCFFSSVALGMKAPPISINHASKTPNKTSDLTLSQYGTHPSYQY